MRLARFDTIVVPFPFADLPVTRRRPALVVSEAGWNAAAGHVVAAMITSAHQSDWPLDVPVTDLAAAGLTAPCRVRMKLFTLDSGLIIRRAGQLSTADGDAVTQALARLLAAG
ncbi:MAG: transcriptional regulator [Alphaproteobacteria bacterium PA4]|nr:MAG: transcriptional regulator [Alphaproteobacteria bacterium PA4]